MRTICYNFNNDYKLDKLNLLNIEEAMSLDFIKNKNGRCYYISIITCHKE